MAPDLLVIPLPIRQNFDQNHIFPKWKLGNYDLMNQKVILMTITKKIVLWFLL